MVQVVRTPSKSKRWVEHFSELLNQPSELDTTILKEIEQLPIDESLDVPITEDKLDESLKNNKDSRMYMEGGRLRDFCLRLFQGVYGGWKN